MDYLSFFFNKKWLFPMKDTVSIMLKLADEEIGEIDGDIKKTLTIKDQEKLDEAVKVCNDILEKLGVPKEKQFLGTINAGHPGGMLPLTKNGAESLHHDILPKNLYVSDATLLPKSMGNPPILTIMALSKRIANIVLKA